MSTQKEIYTRLAQERKWTAAIRWMHRNGHRVSLSTLRRALDRAEGHTPRQALAIELARQYLNPEPNTTAQPSAAAGG